MSFFSGWFSKRDADNVLLIHAGSTSAGGAYATYAPGEPPTIHYSARVPVEPHDGEAPEAALERAVAALCAQLAHDGGPALLRGTGSAYAARLVAYLGTPWERTSVRAEVVEPGKEFTVSSATEARAIARQREADPARRRIKDAVVATRLNGYETRMPFGKRATRAEFVILASSVDEAAAAAVERAVRAALHRQPGIMAFLPGVYRAVRSLYPHEKEYALIDASGEATAVALIEGGSLAGLRTIGHGTREIFTAAHRAGIHATASPPHGALIDSDRNLRFDASIEKVRVAWREALAAELRSFGSAHALPRTMFLLAEDDARSFLSSALADASLNALWHAGEPPRIVALNASNVAGAVRLRDGAQPDLLLMLLALAGGGRGEADEDGDPA